MSTFQICNMLQQSLQSKKDTEQTRILYFLNCFVEFMVRQKRWTIEQFYRDGTLNGYRFILDANPYKYYQIIIFREPKVLEIQFKNGVYFKWFEWKTENLFYVDSYQVTVEQFHKNFEIQLDTMFKPEDNN